MVKASSKFKKILIANRGEIACRVMRSCAKLGIMPVAIYSKPDREALHVITALKLGGEAYEVGEAPSSESYLNIPKILAICKEAQIDAVHPGYGFLSENSLFCAGLNEQGITFIGPPVNAIEAMGDKIRSKQLAENAGVNIVPGHLEAVSDPEEAVKIAQKIGYPVMLKASAGGGGKGMRLAYNDDEARSGLSAAMNEGRASFGDDRVFIEKFIEQPRHIEIQILGDQHGTILYLAERECSLQRRHQKVIEEAPSPFLDEKTRKAMGAQAVALSQKVGYFSAGTVEFIVDKHKNFYFLEMNTRLQVEHPVTELVTGLDLVEWMIRIAAGEKIDFTQDQVTLSGWAMEARVYAEDAQRGFLPSTGRITKYQEPAHPQGFVRVDSGCYEGAEISMFYDPMIAKLICHGDTRDHALANLRMALDDYVIRGVNHNIPFLSNLIKQDYFKSGEIHTGLIAQTYPDGLGDTHLTPQDPLMFAAASAIAWTMTQVKENPAFDPAQQALAVFFAGDNQQFYSTKLRRLSTGVFMLELEGAGHQKTIELSVTWQAGALLIYLHQGDDTIIMQIKRNGANFDLSHDGARASCLVMPLASARLKQLMPVKQPPDMSKYLLSPMPGMLMKLFVNPGEQVKAGQKLAIIEAMKMENMLYAENDGEIIALNAEEGEALRVDQVILSFA
ncbi:MAG: acetyl-CoA carboxylase biotin carboxylase subunit [Alphaproteobacteria bacterium]